MKNPWILCVSDDGDIRLLVATSLKHLGYKVLTANSYDDALIKLQTAQFALFVISCEFADSSIVDFYQQIRQLDPLVPIIFTSTVDFSDEFLEVVQSGGNYFIVLPEQIIVLTTLVSALLV